MEQQALFRQAVVSTFASLQTLPQRVVVIAGTPEVGYNVPLLLGKASHMGRQLNLDVKREEFERRQALSNGLFAQASAQGQIDFVALDQWLCDVAWCRTTLDGMPIYSDEDHLASTGAELLRPFFAVEFSRMPKP